jgi:excisionase family DNA binding protein
VNHQPITAPSGAELPSPGDLNDLPDDALPGFLVRTAAMLTKAATLMLTRNSRSQQSERPLGPHLERDEAASYLRIKPSTLDTHRRAGNLPATKLGKAYTYRREDLDAFAAGRRGLVVPAKE